MTVGLTAGQESACRNAIVPVELIPFVTVPEACKAMSTVLPLVVVVGDAMSDADRTQISDLAQACGAELFDVEEMPAGREFTLRLLEALARGEKRRFKLA